MSAGRLLRFRGGRRLLLSRAELGAYLRGDDTQLHPERVDPTVQSIGQALIANFDIPTWRSSIACSLQASTVATWLVNVYGEPA